MPPAKPIECDRALDFIVANPRSDHALESCSDKGALISSALAENLFKRRFSAKNGLGLGIGMS